MCYGIIPSNKIMIAIMIIPPFVGSKCSQTKAGIILADANLDAATYRRDLHVYSDERRKANRSQILVPRLNKINYIA